MEQELDQVVRDQQHQAQSVEAERDGTDTSEDKSAGDKKDKDKLYVVFLKEEIMLDTSVPHSEYFQINNQRGEAVGQREETIL